MTDLPNSLVALFLLLVGLPLGSFYNVVAYRLPRGQTPWSPRRSHCPSCDAEIAARDNIPVISWLLLRGRCRSCGAAISWRYPAFEALTALLFAAAGWKFGLSRELVPALLLISTLVIVANADLDQRVVPNKVIVPALILGVAAQLFAVPDQWVTWTAAALIAFSAMFLVALVYPAGMGMGDVKLAAVLGLYLGRAVAPAMLIAFLTGTLVGLIVMARSGVAEGRKTALPFAPFMAIGGVVGLFWGEQMVQWYLDTFAAGPQ
jgi:leader peptidase (prepilin peptidase)/N-methyltransferase